MRPLFEMAEACRAFSYTKFSE